jgi:hypothetical protein
LRVRRWTALILVLAFGCAVVGVSAAAARPPAKKPAKLKMLPKVGCQGLLTLADFPGTVTETTLAGGVFGPIEEGKKGVGAFITTCQFDPPEPTEADPEPSTNVGVDVLAVEPWIEFESHGRRNNLLLAFPPLSDSSRFQLHGIGTRAYYEITEEGGAIGYLQVRNDIFYVAKEETAGIRSMLATVASELCKSCSEAEIPRSAES